MIDDIVVSTIPEPATLSLLARDRGTVSFKKRVVAAKQPKIFFRQKTLDDFEFRAGKQAMSGQARSACLPCGEV